VDELSPGFWLDGVGVLQLLSLVRSLVEQAWLGGFVSVVLVEGVAELFPAPVG
jgi:hypothetical protein